MIIDSNLLIVVNMNYGNLESEITDVVPQLQSIIENFTRHTSLIWEILESSKKMI